MLTDLLLFDPFLLLFFSVGPSSCQLLSPVFLSSQQTIPIDQTMQPRQPLAVKSTNVQRSRSTSPLKRAESPTKKSVFTSSPTKKARSSPEKRELSSTPTLKHPSIQEQPFTIFQDSTYARNESASKSPTSSPRHIIPIFQDAHLSDKENGPDNSLDTQSENKENIHITTPCISPLSQRQSVHARKALTDLNINTFPGYIHEGPLKPLMQFQQLREPWSTNSFSNSVKPGKRLMVPSYVTPPKRNRVRLYKYVSDSNSHTQVKNLLPKLKSRDDSYQPDFPISSTIYVYNDQVNSGNEHPIV